MKNPEIPRGTEMYPEESKKLKPRAKNGNVSRQKLQKQFDEFTGDFKRLERDV